MARQDPPSNDAVPVVRSLFQPYLEPGEKILWVGRPGRIHFCRARKPGSPMERLGIIALCVIGLTVASAVRGIEKHPDRSWVFMTLVGFVVVAGMTALIFILSSASLLLMWPLRLYGLRRLSYALTDRRALVLDRSSQKSPKFVAYDEWSRFESFERADGSGLVVFGYKDEVRPKWKSRVISKTPRLVFDDIDQASFVCSIAERARQTKVGFDKSPTSCNT